MQHGFSCYNCVCVVGCGDNNAIDALHQFGVVKHFTIIPEAGSFWELVKHSFRIIPVNVAQRHKVFSGLYVIDIGMSNTSNTDSCNVHLVGWRDMSKTLAQDRAGGNGEACYGSGSRL